ncbi:MAG: threonine synthase [Sandaracinaceae bacterium]|nr:threonine synthase [Sandaracinaceae bacterium]
MPHAVGLRCVRCAAEHAAPGAARPVRYACEACGGNLDVVYDYAAVRRELSRASLAADPDHRVWRYRALLPVDAGVDAERLNVSRTPLAAAPALGARLGLPSLWLKDETRHPSASLKDRASAITLAMARARGAEIVAGASTGNAASSLACLAARTGTRAVLFVPESIPSAKLAQILLFGATVIAVRGTYDQAADLCLAACERYGWYDRDTGRNPYTREGKKTAAFEILEQLGWRVPDWVVVSVGDGNILSGLHKGFTDLREVGLVDGIPRLLAVQAEHSDAVKRAFEGDGVIRAVSGVTIADSISVGLPRDGDAAVRALRESDGAAVAVTDDAILDAMRELARTEGLFAEPAAAAAVAGLELATREGRIREAETVVAVVTGSGLKDVASATRAAGAPLTTEPDLDALDEVVRGRIEA